MANLTLQSIFSSDEFSDEGFNRPRWCGKESFYTTLRKWVPVVGTTPTQSLNSMNSSDLTTTTVSESSNINSIAYEIVWHDASSGNYSTLVSVDQLSIPDENGTTSKTLLIEDYTLSADRSKVLLFSDSKKVWRFRTRGSYWVLDLSNTGSQPLRRLGGKNSSHSDLMFATFCPNDSSKVAYVRNHNIYLEDVNTNESIALTTDGSDNLINGTFDWVYEEEFQMRNGFRWSPDGSRIAFWQINQEGVPVMTLINNTDSLYSKVIPIPYPKTGQTNPSARVGVVSVDAEVRGRVGVQWLKITEDTRNNYIGGQNKVKSLI